ncbi:hypothetical protein PG985_013742 [Apiospora marii]|uniref:Uncharacterized protein n=1 Tax=Apiospora marii TaxID=335849 RepID=A0ABR1R8Y7_9PEZI
MYASQILTIFTLALAVTASPLLPRVDRSHDGIYGPGGKLADLDGTPVDGKEVDRSGDGIYGPGGKIAELDGTPVDRRAAGEVAL